MASVNALPGAVPTRFGSPNPPAVGWRGILRLEPATFFCSPRPRPGCRQDDSPPPDRRLISRRSRSAAHFPWTTGNVTTAARAPRRRPMCFRTTRCFPPHLSAASPTWLGLEGADGSSVPERRKAPRRGDARPRSALAAAERGRAWPRGSSPADSKQRGASPRRPLVVDPMPCSSWTSRSRISIATSRAAPRRALKDLQRRNWACNGVVPPTPRVKAEALAVGRPGGR